MCGTSLVINGFKNLPCSAGDEILIPVGEGNKIHMLKTTKPLH